MTKAELIDSVYEKVGGFSKKEAAEIVEAVFETMKTHLSHGEKIKVSGFGNFVVRSKQGRMGRNPRTGDPQPISPRQVLTFKPSQVLRAVLNPHRGQVEGASDGAKAHEPTFVASNGATVQVEKAFPSSGGAFLREHALHAVESVKTAMVEDGPTR